MIDGVFGCRRVVGLGVWLGLGVCLLALTGRAEGRTGDDYEACVERYGEVVERYAAEVKESDGEGVHFRKDYLDYYVEFRDGKAWSIKVVKRGLKPEERDALLAEEGVVFEGPETYGGKRFWISERGTIHGMEMDVGRLNTMRVMTADYVRALAKAQGRREGLVGTPKAAAYYSSPEVEAE